MSVINGAKLHSINPFTGVASISPPLAQLSLLRSSLGRRRYPYSWRQRFLEITVTMLDLTHSKENSRGAFSAYSTFVFTQNVATFARFLKVSHHLLPLSNVFHCLERNTSSKQPSLRLFSVAPRLGSLAFSSAIAT